MSFPDVLGDAPENVKNNDYSEPDAASDSDVSLDELLGDDASMGERWYSEPGASDSDISLGELLGDYDDIELNDIEDGVSSYKGNRSSKRKRNGLRNVDSQQLTGDEMTSIKTHNLFLLIEAGRQDYKNTLKLHILYICHV